MTFSPSALHFRTWSTFHLVNENDFQPCNGIFYLFNNPEAPVVNFIIFPLMRNGRGDHFTMYANMESFCNIWTNIMGGQVQLS